MSPQERLQQALEGIQDGLALLRFAASDLPVAQRHLFLQAVSALEKQYKEVRGLLEPVDA